MKRLNHIRSKKKAAKMVGICGIVCTDCPAYIATITDDKKLRKEVAKAWSKEFSIDIHPREIHCEGCATKEGKVINHCTVCEIRKCGFEKKVLNCAYCDQYMCEKLSSFISVIPEARLTLESIRASHNKIKKNSNKKHK